MLKTIKMNDWSLIIQVTSPFGETMRNTANM